MVEKEKQKVLSLDEANSNISKLVALSFLHPKIVDNELYCFIRNGVLCEYPDEQRVYDPNSTLERLGKLYLTTEDSNIRLTQKVTDYAFDLLEAQIHQVLEGKFRAKISMTSQKFILKKRAFAQAA